MPALVVVISAEVLVLVLDVAELVVCVVQFPFGPHFHSRRPVHPVNRASDMFKVVVVAETVATDSMTKSKAIMALKRCAGASRARPVILPVGTRNAAVGECNWLGANQTQTTKDHTKRKLERHLTIRNYQTSVLLITTYEAYFDPTLTGFRRQPA
jgi:hypothetical protein